MLINIQNSRQGMASVYLWTTEGKIQLHSSYCHSLNLKKWIKFLNLDITLVNFYKQCHQFLESKKSKLLSLIQSMTFFCHSILLQHNATDEKRQLTINWPSRRVSCSSHFLLQRLRFLRSIIATLHCIVHVSQYSLDWQVVPVHLACSVSAWDQVSQLTLNHIYLLWCCPTNACLYYHFQKMLVLPRSFSRNGKFMKCEGKESHLRRDTLSYVMAIILTTLNVPS